MFYLDPEGKRFNPRARMGRDLSPTYRTSCKAGFNPRARMGRDCIAIYSCSSLTLRHPMRGCKFFRD